MQKVSEYEQNAAECRQKAPQTTDLQLKKQFEEMAKVWDRLARERQHGVERVGGAFRFCNPDKKGRCFAARSRSLGKTSEAKTSEGKTTMT